MFHRIPSLFRFYSRCAKQLRASNLTPSSMLNSHFLKRNPLGTHFRKLWYNWQVSSEFMCDPAPKCLKIPSFIWITRWVRCFFKMLSDIKSLDVYLRNPRKCCSSCSDGNSNVWFSVRVKSDPQIWESAKGRMYKSEMKCEIIYNNLKRTLF